MGAVRDMGVRAPVLPPADAFGEFRGASIYEEGLSGSPRPLDFATVSLPAAGSVPVKLAGLHSPGGSDFGQDFINRSLAKPDGVRAELAAAPAVPYVEVNLRQDRGAYVACVRRLAGCGMLELVT